MTLWIVAMLPLAIVGFALVVLFREMVSRTSPADFDPAWLEDFSIAKYRPMLRLLSEDDYEFLASQAGYEAKIASQLRMERRKVFRAYLRNLVRDFNRLHNAAKIMAVCSAQDRPDLTQALLKQQLTFSFAVAAVKVRLMLHTVGIGTVEVRNLLASVDHLRSEIGQLTPVAGQAA
jgi:hypothetical protein